METHSKITIELNHTAFFGWENSLERNNLKKLKKKSSKSLHGIKMTTELKSLTDRLPEPMQLWEKRVSGVGICVMKDLEFVEQKDAIKTICRP